MPGTFKELAWIAQTGDDAPRLLAESVLGKGDPADVMPNYAKEIERGPSPAPDEDPLLTAQDILADDPNALEKVIRQLQNPDEAAMYHPQFGAPLNDEQMAAMIDDIGPSIFALAGVDDPTAKEADKWYDAILSGAIAPYPGAEMIAMVEAATQQQITEGKTEDDDGFIQGVLDTLGAVGRFAFPGISEALGDDYSLFPGIAGLFEDKDAIVEQIGANVGLPDTGFASMAEMSVPEPFDTGMGPIRSPWETTYEQQQDVYLEQVREDLRSSIEDSDREDSDAAMGNPAGTRILFQLNNDIDLSLSLLPSFLSFVGANSDMFDPDVLEEIRGKFKEYALISADNLTASTEETGQGIVEPTPSTYIPALGGQAPEFHGLDPQTANEAFTQAPIAPEPFVPSSDNIVSPFLDQGKQTVDEIVAQALDPYGDTQATQRGDFDVEGVTSLWGAGNNEQDMFDREVAKLPGGARYHLNRSPGGSRQLWEDADTLYWLYNSDPTSQQRIANSDPSAISDYQNWMSNYIGKGPRQFIEDLPDLDDKIRRLLDNLKLFESLSTGNSQYAASEAEWMEQNPERANEYISHKLMFHPGTDGPGKIKYLINFLGTRNLGGLNASYSMRQGLKSMYDLQVAQNRTPAEVAEMFANAYGYSMKQRDVQGTQGTEGDTKISLNATNPYWRQGDTAEATEYRQSLAEQAKAKGEYEAMGGARPYEGMQSI